MTGLTGGREACGRVAGARGRLVILPVAIHAHNRSRLEVATFVTRLTSDRSVGRVERHAGGHSVIPPHCGPRCRAMTLLALGAETRLKLVVLPTHPMALVASLGRVLVSARDVTRLACQRKVLAFEGERRRVVECPAGRGELAEHRGAATTSSASVTRPAGRRRLTVFPPSVPRWPGVRPDREDGHSTARRDHFC